MVVNYDKLHDLLNRKGLSIGTLIKEGVIKDFSGRKIRNNDYVDLKHIDALCQYLNVPIEEIVEITPDGHRSE